ncbi:hypothetical protein [Pyrococcus abyssi]|uniref:Uncharacterized protein n=1 Tax=Pyrococcus abyssi (strain GE5 / Orsay) TaxID=272844 RepID=Q9UY37_PYRAB|nr:hypothetical protein [Pyrococcus abyssi]CAB50575.1 Hypothetical protein PAB1096 [Pyrococcus abyssi GE5]CCE71139.1 TPA: hypothetical protein PAB1096 [Pyrococcus abyssi GE5]
MDKKIASLAVVLVVVLVVAVRTAEIPPATIVGSAEIFMVNNTTATIVEKDGWGLFTLTVKPKITGFTLRLEFPQGTTYLIKINGKEIKGKDVFETKISQDSEIIVSFQLPKEDTRKLYSGEGQYYIKVKASKMPFWNSEYVIYLLPREKKD